MHPRNPYRTPPDFNGLAEDYPALKAFLIPGATTIDFKNQLAQRALTSAILKRDFGVNGIELLEDRLCPAVPNRLNYIFWLQDLVNANHCGLDYMDRVNGSQDDIGKLNIRKRRSQTVRGIDIGTGASAIYPILGCKLDPNWEFVATEIDPKSYTVARSNSDTAGLSGRVKVVKVNNEGDGSGRLLVPLFRDERDEDKRQDVREDRDTPDFDFDFTMCNPPFYASHREVEQSREGKERAPNAICTGADVEMIYTAPSTNGTIHTEEKEGGECGFVARMVRESLHLTKRCLWYTSMLGKLSSVGKIVGMLRMHGVTNYAVTEFVQGQTRRWAVGWSFHFWRLDDSISRLSHVPATHPLYSLMPPKTTLVVSIPEVDLGAQKLNATLKEVLSAIEGVVFQEKSTSIPDSGGFIVYAERNTWSRSARRKRKRDELDGTTSGPTSAEEGGSNLGMLCAIRIYPTSAANTPELVFQWVYGAQRDVYEGFVSHVGRMVRVGLTT